MPPETASPAHHVLRAEFLKQAVEMPPWFSHIANCAMASGAVKCASSDDYLDKGRDGGLRTEPRLFSGRPLMRPAIYSKCDVSPRGHTLEGKVLYCTVTDPGPWELEEPARVMRKHRTREPVNQSSAWPPSWTRRIHSWVLSFCYPSQLLTLQALSVCYKVESSCLHSRRA